MIGQVQMQHYAKSVMMKCPNELVSFIRRQFLVHITLGHLDWKFAIYLVWILFMIQI